LLRFPRASDRNGRQISGPFAGFTSISCQSIKLPLALSGFPIVLDPPWLLEISWWFIVGGQHIVLPRRSPKREEQLDLGFFVIVIEDDTAVRRQCLCGDPVLAVSTDLR
jgi:hypothetical protein